jgi:hypothetical protein
MIRAPETVRSKMVFLRVNASELRRIESAAKKHGNTSVSEWLREIVHKTLDERQTR